MRNSWKSETGTARAALKTNPSQPWIKAQLCWKLNTIFATLEVTLQLSGCRLTYSLLEETRTSDTYPDATHRPHFGSHGNDGERHAARHEWTLVHARGQTTHHARQAEIGAQNCNYLLINLFIYLFCLLFNYFVIFFNVAVPLFFCVFSVVLF